MSNSKLKTGDIIIIHIVLLICYPAVFVVASWNAVGDYIDAVTENGLTFRSYIKALKAGAIEFKNCHKRIYKNMLNYERHK